MKRLILIAALFCTGCAWQGYHFGPHHYELTDSFQRNDRTYYVFRCYKDPACRAVDTFPNPKFDPR